MIIYEQLFMYKRCYCSLDPKESKFSEEQFRSLESDLKLVGVKARLEILFLLKNNSHCACDLMTHTGFSQSLISHHLSDLQTAGFITSKRDGIYVEFSLTKSGNELLHALELIVASNNRSNNT